MNPADVRTAGTPTPPRVVVFTPRDRPFVGARGRLVAFAPPQEGPVFAGFVAMEVNQEVDRLPSVTEPYGQVAPERIKPINVTEFSAGNRVRRGIVPILLEWWRWRRVFSGEYFVDQISGEIQTADQIPRAFVPPRRLTKVLPNRRFFYAPQEYGAEVPAPEGAAPSAPGAPGFAEGEYSRRPRIGAGRPHLWFYGRRFGSGGGLDR